MRAIAVGDEIGIGAAETVGTRDRVAANAANNFEKRVDMFCQGGWYHRMVVVWGDRRVMNNHSRPLRDGRAGRRSRTQAAVTV